MPEALQPQQVVNLLNRLGHRAKTRWNVRIMERYRHGAGVATYLARYLRGGPIKNARLVAWDGDRVTFTYRASAEAQASGAVPQSRMTLSSTDFLQRWLLHVPTPQSRVVRSYGLYHPPTRRRWRSAGPTWGNRPWPCRSLWCGRPRVPSVATPIQNGVRPADSCWCAPRSSRGRAPRRQCWRRTVPHEGLSQRGTACQGRGVPAASLVGAGGVAETVVGFPMGRGPRSPVPQPTLLVGAARRMTARAAGITSIACAGGTSSDQVGTRSVQPGVEADTWPPGVGGEGVARWRPGAA